MASSSSSIASYLSKLATTNKILATATSIAAATMAIHSFSKTYLPSKLRTYIQSKATDFFDTYFSNQFTLIIDEFVNGMVRNEIYEAAQMHLSSKIDPKTRRLRVTKAVNESRFNVTMEPGKAFVDVYNGEEFRWVRVTKLSKPNSTEPMKKRSLVLTFHHKNKDLVMDSYLPYLINKAETTKQERRTVEIFNMSNGEMGRMWKKVTFDHPATFDTLAMDSDKKEMILSDLDRFVGRREHYRRVGKAWKRGYLLYGPPGTGKSSLIAAIANYLKFNVYDLQLTGVRGNSQLSRLLLATANKSILVVEDIDCNIDLQTKMAKRGDNTLGVRPDQDISLVTLSGLLNFVDGLWSSCGDERIIIFTTNHKEKLDPALLRPGRMDVHIHLSYCSPCGFELLASNYLGIMDHVLFKEIEDLLPNAKVTPAEVAEQLLQNDEPDIALEGLVDFIHKKIKEKENEEAEAKKKAKSATKLAAKRAAEKLAAKPETDQQEECKENGKKLETDQPKDSKEKGNEDKESTSS